MPALRGLTGPLVLLDFPTCVNARTGHGGEVYDGETSIWLLLTIPVHNREKVYTAVCLTAASTQEMNV